MACLDYDMEYIFNVDETGIFFRPLPKRTNLSTAQNRTTDRGTKAMKAKDRESAYMCTNATRDRQGPHSDNRQVQESALLSCHALSGKLFRSGERVVGQRYVQEVVDGGVHPHFSVMNSPSGVLLNDGCASHEDVLDPRGQIKTMVHPPNCTSKYQPQDMGIIAATKRDYRRRFLEVRA